MKMSTILCLCSLLLAQYVYGQTEESDKTVPIDTLSEIIVKSLLRPEKITQAPVPIQVLTPKDIKMFAGSNVGELYSYLQGVEFTRYGVDGITFNARGFNSAFNNKILQIVDGRISTAALSGGLPIFNNGTINKDDIEQLEIVIGPQTALYGPNAHNGVFNTITKDPFRYQGTTVSLSAGSQSQFSSRVRIAYKINNRFAWKINGEYARGREFNFRDSVYVGNPQMAIPEYNVDFDFNHLRGETQLHFKPTLNSTIVLAGGSSTNDFLQVTSSGRNQMKGFSYQYIQLRYLSPNFYGNVYNTWGSLGDSYVIGPYTQLHWLNTMQNPSPLPPEDIEKAALDASRFREKSRRLNAELQYNKNFSEIGLFVVGGIDFENIRPNIDNGNTLVGKSGEISVNQIGAVIQLEKKLPWQLRAIGALRYDSNDNFKDLVAPKITLVKDLENGNIRIGWGKAYALPSIQNRYANVRGILFGNSGTGISFIPNNSIVSDPNSIVQTEPLKPEEVNTIEFGISNQLLPMLRLNMNAFYGENKNFISTSLPVGGRALSVNGIPVTHNPMLEGTVRNDSLQGANFFTFFNYGRAIIYGIDTGITLDMASFGNFTINYSWLQAKFENNDADGNGVITEDEKSINAPNHRGSARWTIQNLLKNRLDFSLGARFVGQYDFYSGSQIGSSDGEGTRIPPRKFNYGPLGDFTTFDTSLNYKFNNKLSLNFNISNLFNTKQIEFVGSPSIGRLAMASITITD